jgi:TonB-dependent receptor
VNGVNQERMQDRMKLRPLCYAVSMALASLMAANAAMAQATQDNTKSETKVTVVGTRASQQSANERKKNAATAMDSIVAEDVGALPDRNVGEAISRLSGIALERGDFGEGINVAVRGNSADLTRVELDGQGLQAGGGTDLNGGGSGRGVELRELSSDLIKSVDVVKGSTADMTEGSLGGGIIIKTRTGLDFKKPFYSVRVAASQGSLNKEWSPDTNVILANKFLDNRLGVLLNVSTSQMHNEGHSSQVATSANQGYARALDFDNSPNKTFAFNPSTVSTTDPTATAPLLSTPLIGGGFFNAASPLELVTRSAAAQSKADCYAMFPNLTAQQQNAIAAGAARNGAINQRGNELMTCLNQWNDYTPSLVRYLMKKQIDKRRSGDLRLDFKVNNEFTVYAKGSIQRRRVDDNFLTYGLGGLSVNTNTTSPAYTGITFTDSAAGVRSAVPGSGYYLYDSPSFRTNNFPAMGAVANVNPASVVVDANHHVTRFTISDGSAGVDQIHNIIETSSRYLQTGGTYKDGPLLVEYFVGDAKSDFTRGDKRTSWSYNYGPATLQVLPNGLWTYSFPAGSAFDQGNAANYAVARPAVAATTAVPASATVPVAIPAYTINQQPLMTQAPQLSFTPRGAETHERTAKLDATYGLSDQVPFLSRLKAGINLRDTSGNSWNPNGGYTVQAPVGTFGTAAYVPGVYVPQSIVRSSFVGCENTPGSLGAGGAPCKYGFNPSTNPSTALSGQAVMTQQQFQDIITQAMTQRTTTFFNGAKDRPEGLINGWTQIDVEKVFQMAGIPNVNYNCLKECTGSDGKKYAQPVGTFRERVRSGYLMTDYSVDHLPFTDRALPFGWELDGNFGYRVVNTRVEGTGIMSFTSIQKTAAYNPSNPNAVGGIVTNTLSTPASLSASTTDYLPAFNAALWTIPDQLVWRYNRAKTVARPPVSALLPAGTCTYDERKVGAIDSSGNEPDQTCSGTVGNPALRPQTNWNQNFSAEWYPNRDTMFSLAAFHQKGMIGPAIVQGKSNVKVFSGSQLIDPQTGVSLGDVDFNYNTWVNGAATTRKGLEFGSKTAFTFLPWYLRYTGFDANYTKLRSATSAENVVDLITGAKLPPARESKYSYNLALWYDDGALSARVAIQAVASYFTCIAACGANSVNNYPSSSGVTRITVTPYNPGSPNFRDGTRYIDAKIAYRFKNGIEIFAEGRNLGRATTSNSQGPFSPFADGTPNLLDYSYAGRRIMIGMNIRSL